MSEITKYLRFLVPCDREAVITRVNATPTPTEFETQLSGGYGRRRIGVYNNSDSGSGECYYSFVDTATVGASSIPIPKGDKLRYIPIGESDDITLYFFCDAGELGDLRVIELA